MLCLMACECVLWCLDTCSSQTQHWLFLPAYKYTERETHIRTLYTHTSLLFQNNNCYLFYTLTPLSTHKRIYTHATFCLPCPLTSYYFTLVQTHEQQFSHKYIHVHSRSMCNLCVYGYEPLCQSFLLFQVSVFSGWNMFSKMWMWQSVSLHFFCFSVLFFILP